LISRPVFLLSVSNLRDELGVVGIQHAEPGVARAIDLVNLGHGQRDSGAVSFLSPEEVFGSNRSVGQRILSPVGHGISSLGIVNVQDGGVESDSTGAPLHVSQLSHGAVGRVAIIFRASVSVLVELVDSGQSKPEAVSSAHGEEGLEFGFTPSESVLETLFVVIAVPGGVNEVLKVGQIREVPILAHI